MPRKSADALSGEAWRRAAMPAAPPAHMSAAGKRLWVEIIQDRSESHFRPGSHELLATFCEATVRLDALWRAERRCRQDPRAHIRTIRQICALAQLQARLCGDLRLTPRAAIERHSAVREKRGRPQDALLGGHTRPN